MDLFKEATKRKIRFSSPKGNLTVENLWSLGYDDLKEIVIGLYKEKEELSKTADGHELSFLNNAGDEKLSEKELVSLKFDIASDVYKTRKSEDLQATEFIQKQKSIKQLEYILAKKKEDSLENLSVEELEAKIKELRGK